VLSWLTSKLQPPLPPLSGGSFSPVLLPSPGVLGNEACGGSPYSPLPAFPLPVTSGWNTGPWAFSRASHPAVASSACQERERALSTRPELTVDNPTLHSSYLTHAVRPHVAPRFPSARKLASWAGLTPTVRGSDLKVRHGHISKQGSVWLRWVMNQAAQTAKRSPEFAATYSSIARRRGKKIATIAVSRKLLTRAWHLLSGMQAADAGTPPRRP
jgi:Transposase IS116/IS110/IS902 family